MNNQFFDSLKNNLLFKNTDITSLNLDEVKGRLVRVGEGEIVYREGAPSDFIYLIVSGQINIIKKKILGKAKSYIYKENEFFGNDEYFEETTRTTTAVALVDSYLIILSREEMETLIYQDNEIFLALRESLSGLFDNSTEINVSEEDNTPPEPQTEIEKIITGEEISTELHDFTAPAEAETIQIEPVLVIEDDIKPFETEVSGFKLSENDLSVLEQSASEPEDASVEEAEIKEEYHSENEILMASVLAGSEEIIPASEKTSPEPVIEEEEKDPLDFMIIDNGSSLGDLSGAHEELITSPTGEKTAELYIEENFVIEISPVNSTNKVIPLEGAGGEMNKDEVTKIINAMELVNSTVKIDDLLTSIVNVACDLTSADRGTLYLVDKEKGELWSKIAMGTEPKEIRLKIGEGIAGTVARTKTIENIKDVTKHPMFKKDVDKASGYVTKNMLCFPLKNKEEEVIGVLQLLNSKNGEFTDHDEEVLSMISINTAIALQNAELVEKLLTAERVSSLGKMTNFLIQDIKKPVLVSKRYTEHLKSKSLAPEVTQLVDMILAELTQVADLVQTTSSYAEGKTILRTTVTGINAVLQDFISRIEQFVISRHCKIHFDPDKEFNVKVDSKEFYQCFQHIVKNACDAMPDGGTLNIKTMIDGKTVRIVFEDQGLGIPESFIDKIFEPFMTHGKKEGAGLGLSITKKIVEAHQGTIDVKSSLGAGATFTVTLPAGS